MTETTTEQRDIPRMLGFIIPLLPSLIFRFGGEFLRFRSQARKGAGVFQDELVRQGIDETTAARLSSLYLEGSDPFKMLRSLR
jgi:hypothetical protein